MTSEEIKEPPVYTVHGANWKANVPLDTFNMQFSEEAQMLEAATRAIEIFKGIFFKNEPINPHSIDIQLDTGEQEPIIGPVLMVHIKDGNPNEGDMFPTHIILADGGFHLDSIDMLKVWIEQLEIIKKEQEAEEAKLLPPVQISEEVKIHELPKAEIKPEPPQPAKVKKPRKPKK